MVKTQSGRTTMTGNFASGAVPAGTSTLRFRPAEHPSSIQSQPSANRLSKSVSLRCDVQSSLCGLGSADKSPCAPIMSRSISGGMSSRKGGTNWIHCAPTCVALMVPV